MQMYLLIVPLVLGLAHSHPTAEGAVAAKRDATERVFLADCDSYNGVTGVNVHRQSSEMDYYATDAEARTGEYPDAVASISSGSYAAWEGNTVSGTFHDGDVFTAVIDAGAANYSFNQYAGYGWNKYRSFYCYKDDLRGLWGWAGSPSSGASGGCASAYYCVDA